MITALLLALAAFVVWWLYEKRRRPSHPVPEGLREAVELPHRQAFELYHNALSLCSMKSRLCLAELGIAYESHHVNLIETGAYENIRPAFLAVNPGGTVPVLVHRGHPVYESHAQIRYAAQHAPPGSPELVPHDAALRAEMERWIDRSSLTKDPLEHGEASAGNAVPGVTLPLFASMLEIIPLWKILEGVLFHFDRKRPLVFLAFKLRRIGHLHRIPAAMKVLARSRHQIAAHLDALEAQLASSGGPFILGSLFSLADVSWLVIFERLAQADFLHVFVRADCRPACVAYWQALRERPSYAEAIAAHTHSSILYGTQRIREAKAADPALRAALEGDEQAPA